ncbi:MAG: DUF2877 domain-containing protein [Pseudonocardiaceae bacterium]
MRALDVGLGAREVLDDPGGGRVVAVYSRAAYLRFPVGLLTVTSARAPAGPLHLRCPVLPALRPGTPVWTDGFRLTGPGWAVALDAPTWVGELPALPAVAPLPAAPDLATLAARLGGRGPGLTPAGDDVLAGALLAARARCGPAAEPELSAVAASVRTAEPAAAFLTWAARGQCIEPAHAVLLALAARDEPRAHAAAARLVAVGASSGAALLAGLGWIGPTGTGAC